jgi:hypothetical protein
LQFSDEWQVTVLFSFAPTPRLCVVVVRQTMPSNGGESGHQEYAILSNTLEQPV